MAECDHKNGNVLDFTADNLEWVHPKENRWRADHVLKPMRKVGIDPARYTGKAMDIWFEVFRTPGAEQLTADELYRLFALLLRKKHIPETLTTLNH